MSKSYSQHRVRAFKRGHAAVLQFASPNDRNRLSLQTLGEFEDRLAWAQEQDGCDSIVITGSGGSFASGADINELATLDGDSARQFGEYGQSVMARVELCRKPTLAAIDGFCFGGGLDLALACDYRIATEESVFCHPGVSLGIITGWGGTQRLPRLIGQQRSLEMFLTARRYSARDSLQFGLVDEISAKPVDRAIGFSVERK